MIGTNAAVLLLLLGWCSSIEGRIRHTKEKARPLDPDAFLTKFGYLEVLPRGIFHEPRTRNEAIRNFQRMVGLPITGRPDKRTLWKMGQPRCGLPDKAPVGSGVPAAALTDPSNNPMNYYVPGFKWPKHDLKYRVVNYSPDLYWGTQRDTFRKAFDKWSQVTPLNFRAVETPDQDIEIKFAAGNHGDGSRNSFDGPGGVLAHAYYPEVGDTHFDEDETWTDETSEGTNLLNVATHELGHALGLGHSNVPHAVMAPYYQGYDPYFKLQDDDIRAIQSLYGSRQDRTEPTPPVATTTTTTTTTTTPRSTTTLTSGEVTPSPRPTRRPKTPRPPKPTKKPTPVPNPCKMKADAVYQAPDQRVFMFRGQWVWRLDDAGVTVGYPQRAAKLFEKPPRSLGAAVYSTRTGYTYFFKRNKVFKYYGYRRLIKKKVTSKGYPKAPQAALIGRDGRIYLFQGAYYWVFDEATLDIVADSTPRPISKMWPGIPPNVEAVTRYRDGNIYFFKGRKYRKFSERLRRVVDGYPKKMAPAWYGALCGGTARAPRLQLQ
ncbi:hypothetical protein NP493_477g03036 [Ridgeia piscesae]|uniref:Peptidase metallopeptidase domain-containing protein n=1 Tax=Ridgeia piscesae TaxID=27915 RepID=A0AAD9KY32_RIDPI|nr:hypothetical protein NP493_477g03036 [Ridgeia piscesae]